MIGWIGAMCALGLILGTPLWTILTSVTSPAVTWFVVAVVLGVRSVDHSALAADRARTGA